MALYSKGKKEMFSDIPYWADANSTLRVSFGQIEGSYPRDGDIMFITQQQMEF